MNDALQAELAPQIAPVVLANVATHYPYHDAHLYTAQEPSFDAIAAHPAFGNGFDWHSSVHSHWTALQVLEHFARRGEQPEIGERVRAAVTRNLQAHNVVLETDYLRAHPGYERPYGRAWALLLAAAVARSQDAGLRERAPALHALGAEIAVTMVRWLRALPGPVRHGVHSNTAFSLGLLHDAAVALDFDDLQRVVNDCAERWFAAERCYPHEWERSAHDFLSPGLAQADLVRRLLPSGRFERWWARFLGAAPPDAEIFMPASVPAGADGQLVHLHGLNLSRAAMLARIGQALGADGAPLQQHALALYRAGAGPACGDDYLSTHWLPTFAWDAARCLDAAAAAAK